MEDLGACPHLFSDLQILVVHRVEGEYTIEAFQVVKKDSVLREMSTFFFLLIFSSLMYGLKEVTNAIGSPVVVDGLLTTPCVANQDGYEGVGAVQQTFNVCKD